MYSQGAGCAYGIQHQSAVKGYATSMEYASRNHMSEVNKIENFVNISTYPQDTLWISRKTSFI